MKLTKLQRYTAYCILLEECAEGLIGGWTGICQISSYVFDIRLLVLQEQGFPTFKKIFPELHSKITRNEFYHAFLFNNWQERIDALKQCISETEPF